MGSLSVFFFLSMCACWLCRMRLPQAPNTSLCWGKIRQMRSRSRRNIIDSVSEWVIQAARQLKWEIFCAVSQNNLFTLSGWLVSLLFIVFFFLLCAYEICIRISYDRCKSNCFVVMNYWSGALGTKCECHNLFDICEARKIKSSFVQWSIDWNVVSWSWHMSTANFIIVAQTQLLITALHMHRDIISILP